MALKIVAVYDFKVEAFMPPFFVPHIGSAIRSFGDVCKKEDPNSPISMHPEDYCLYELGEFDDEFARFEPLKDPRVICSGSDFKE